MSIKTTEPIFRDWLARELFETRFGIYNHDKVNPKNPFPLSTFHPTSVRDWGKKHEIKEMIRLRLPERTGLSVNDMLHNTDMETYALIKEAASEIAVEEENSLKALEESKEKEMTEVIDTMKN